MSRVIKFRAWNEELKKFVCWYQQGLSMVGDTGEIYLSGSMNVTSRFGIQQFTGLQDKRGVDIYEGDILSEPASPVGGPDGGYLYKNKVIEWEGAGSGYALFAPHAASKVIGNIYENPELINP